MSKENNKPELKTVPKGEAAVLSEFKPKQNNLSFIFRPNIRHEVMEYYDMVGKPKPFDFKGPDFKDIQGYSLNGPFLIVQTKNDEQYVYPLEDIARIKTYVTTE